MNLSRTELEATDLTRRVENWVEQRTTGRVGNLRVEINGSRVVVHGRTGSYYVRQLVLAAVLDALRAEQVEQIELDIEIVTTPSRTHAAEKPVHSQPTSRTFRNFPASGSLAI